MALRQHTPQQYLDAVIAAGGSRIKAAEAMGVSLHAIWRNLKTLKEQGVEIPDSPYNTGRAEYMVRAAEDAHHAAPEHFHVKGVSTLYGAEGEIKQQWVKTNADQAEQSQALIDALKDVFSEVPRVPEITGPAFSDSSLMTIYPIGDAHCGMHAWAEEAGEDFDLKIFEADLTSAASRVISAAPPSKYGMVVDLGDYIHVNDKSNRTPGHGHMLDADSRYAKIARVAVRSLRSIVDMALTKHELVYLYSRPGNHNPDAYVILQVALGLLYEENPRVIVDQSPSWQVYHEFGKNLIGITHGDKCKMKDLGAVMAADMPEAWGRTNFKTWLTGHIHSDNKYEGRGWTAESFRTLAASDAYAKGAGYRSGRDMKAIVLHEQWGEVERHRVDISLVRSK
jgi:predicted ArsR family transcriptional regulator